MLIAPLDVVVLVVGCLMFCASKNAKAIELGKLMFFAGLLAWLLLAGAWHAIKF